MLDNANPLIAVLLAATLALSGCIGNAEDGLGLLSEDSANVEDANTVVELTATNGSADLAHIGFELDGVFAHDANTSFPDGYHELDLANERADVLTGSDTNTFTLAAGDLEARTYDQVLLRLASAQAHGADSGSGHGGHGGHDSGANASDDGHAHDDGGHAHGDDSSKASGEKAKLAVVTDSFDLPVNVTFDVSEDAQTTVELVLDVGASTTANSFQPTFERVTIKQGNETVTEKENVGIESTFSGDGGARTPAPAARAAVFAPNGDQIYEPSFDVEQGVFVNGLSDAFGVGETVRFSGTESEAVATGSTIASYEWDLGDGNTATGPTAQHAYEDPGVYEVTLTVTDSKDVAGTHTLRVVVASPIETLADTSFEEGPGDWVGESGYLEPTGSTPALISWELDGAGHNSSTAWHAGHAVDEEIDDPGYIGGFEISLTSANYTIPEGWVKAGFQVALQGNLTGQLSDLGEGAGSLTVSYTSNGTTETVKTIEGTDGWIVLDQSEALNELAGQDIQFTFTFSAPIDGVPQGAGFYVDDFSISGLAKTDLANHELLDEATGGHDHGGHSH